jgi:hypothetical protein
MKGKTDGDIIVDFQRMSGFAITASNYWPVSKEGLTQ